MNILINYFQGYSGWTDQAALQKRYFEEEVLLIFFFFLFWFDGVFSFPGLMVKNFQNLQREIQHQDRNKGKHHVNYKYTACGLQAL